MVSRQIKDSWVDESPVSKEHLLNFHIYKDWGPTKETVESSFKDSVEVTGVWRRSILHHYFYLNSLRKGDFLHNGRV